MEEGTIHYVIYLQDTILKERDLFGFPSMARLKQAAVKCLLEWWGPHPETGVQFLQEDTGLRGTYERLKQGWHGDNSPSQQAGHPLDTQRSRSRCVLKMYFLAVAFTNGSKYIVDGCQECACEA